MNIAVHLPCQLREPWNLPRNQASGASPTGTQAESHEYFSTSVFFSVLQSTLVVTFSGVKCWRLEDCLGVF